MLFLSRALHNQNSGRPLACALLISLGVTSTSARADILVGSKTAAGLVFVAEGLGNPEDHTMSFEEIKRSAAALRAALDEKFNSLIGSNSFLGPETDVSRTVEPFIARGMKFSQAEEILRAAGFDVDARPSPDQSKSKIRGRDWYGVLAKINPYYTRFPTKVSLYITLLPKSPGDYSVVENVTASFIISAP